ATNTALARTRASTAIRPTAMLTAVTLSAAVSTSEPSGTARYGDARVGSGSAPGLPLRGRGPRRGAGGPRRGQRGGRGRLDPGGVPGARVRRRGRPTRHRGGAPARRVAVDVDLGGRRAVRAGPGAAVVGPR